jgi:hypothetical protein
VIVGTGRTGPRERALPCCSVLLLPTELAIQRKRAKASGRFKCTLSPARAAG